MMAYICVGRAIVCGEIYSLHISIDRKYDVYKQNGSLEAAVFTLFSFIKDYSALAVESQTAVESQQASWQAVLSAAASTTSTAASSTTASSAFGSDAQDAKTATTANDRTNANFFIFSISLIVNYLII